MSEKNKMGSIDDLLGEGFTDKLHSTINEIKSEQPKVALSIEDFKSNFIDYFTGEEKDEEFIQKWVSYVGGPTVPVNLVHNGELVYTIEPIIKSLEYREYDREKYEPHYVLNQCQSLLAVNPIKSRKMMVNAVRHWVKLHDTEHIYQDSLRWNRVLELCGKEPIDLSYVKYAVYLKKKSEGEDINHEEFSDVSDIGMDGEIKSDSSSEDIDYGEF